MHDMMLPYRVLCKFPVATKTDGVNGVTFAVGEGGTVTGLLLDCHWTITSGDWIPRDWRLGLERLKE